MNRISVVTPTLRRPSEVLGLIKNLAGQTICPHELILVDGAPAIETDTEAAVRQLTTDAMPFRVHYIKHGGGTAVQRNAGIEAARGDFVAFIDDDIRLEARFLEEILGVFDSDSEGRVGGVAGYITNQYLDSSSSFRWRWYRRLRLYTTYEPGTYDYASGYPINRYLRPPHEQNLEIDFMGANCAVWRRQVFAAGLRFSGFFSGYGVLEDAHFALRARRHWKLLECGRAHCVHLSSPHGRENPRLVSRKTAINYRFVFMDIVPRRTVRQEFRFWRVQCFELLRLGMYAILHPTLANLSALLGKIEGILMASSLKNPESGVRVLDRTSPQGMTSASLEGHD